MKFRWVVIVCWILLAGIIFWKAPILSEVAKTDSASFLPSGTDAVQISKMIKELYPDKGNGSSLLLVLQRKEGLKEGDREYARKLEGYLQSKKSAYSVKSVNSPFTKKELEGSMKSKDNKAALIEVDLSVPGFQDISNEIVRSIKKDVQSDSSLHNDSGAPSVPEGLTVNATGDAAIGQEEVDTVQDSMGLTSKITVILVVAILILIYRSPVAPLHRCLLSDFPSWYPEG